MIAGDKIKVDTDRCRYTVQAADERFIIATKPFNARKTYLYTIIDRERSVRGACDMIFGLPCDVDTPDGAKEALEMLQTGYMEVSRRNVLPLTAAELEQVATTGERP
ncbi:MAG: hypothetical protein AAFR65_10420 [Pseudomonadota bacterium]